MGVKEPPERIIQHGVPEGFNGSDFVTFRYGWPHAFVRQKPGKSFLDLSRVPPKDIRPGNTNPHRIIMNHCLGNDAFPFIYNSPFLVYHYAGTFRQFSYREDGRDKRSKHAYSQLNKTIRAFDDGAKFWLPRFVKEVGITMAKALLEGAGELEPWNVTVNYTAS